MNSHVVDVPFVDLKRPYAEIASDLEQEFREIFSSMRLFLGPNVAAFEEEYARYLNVAHCVGVADGTTALHLALRACGVGPGDEVITVSHTFFATVEAIQLVGATPVFVDVDASTYTIDVAAVERAITPRTRAIMPVHLYGLMADIDGIMEVARRHNLRVIEDASQAHGARRRGQAAGTIGDIGTFSFYYSKNLGAYGEAGGLTTNDDDLACRLRVLRDHGSPRRYYHEVVGMNGRLDEVQAAVLRLKLPRLDDANHRRRVNAGRYSDKLSRLPIGLPTLRGEDHVYHLYVVRTPSRDSMQKYLDDRGVHTGIHYPIPCHLQPACSRFGGGPGSLPVTEKLAGEILSLPMFPDLTLEEIDYVVGTIEEFFGMSVPLSTSVDAAG